MKIKTIVDSSRDEEILIYTHKPTRLGELIKQMLIDNSPEIVGHRDKTAVPLNLMDIYCFTVEQNKVFAMTENESFEIKLRLYQIEEKLPKNFIKINQSCIANIKRIEKFDATFSGTLQVIFKNGYKEYVSRRNIKKVKERMGL